MQLNPENAKIRNSISTQESYGLTSLKSTENTKSLRHITVCRICLEEHHNKNSIPDTFIKPCRCSGSLEYVHEDCLIEWLNTMIQRRIEMGQPLETIHCQICQEELNIQFKKRIVCRKKESVKQKLKVFWPHLVVSIIFILLTLGGMGALVFFQINSATKSEEEKVSLRVVCIIGWVLLSISLVIWIIKILRNFFLRRQTYVGKVIQKQSVIEIRQHNQVLSQSIVGSQQIPASHPLSFENSDTNEKLVRRKLKVVPLKPAFRNESADCLGDQMSENSNQFRVL